MCETFKSGINDFIDKYGEENDFFTYQILNKSIKEYSKFNRKKINSTVTFELDKTKSIPTFIHVMVGMQVVIEKIIKDLLGDAKKDDEMNIVITNPFKQGCLNLTFKKVKNFKPEDLLDLNQRYEVIDIKTPLLFEITLLKRKQQENKEELNINIRFRDCGELREWI